jgi:hypothetical protein
VRCLGDIDLTVVWNCQRTVLFLCVPLTIKDLVDLKQSHKEQMEQKEKQLQKFVQEKQSLQQF